MNGEPHYPNLEHCEIIRGATSTGKKKPPIVTISAECLEAMDAPLPEIYDFHVGKSNQSRGETIFCTISASSIESSACMHAKYATLLHYLLQLILTLIMLSAAFTSVEKRAQEKTENRRDPGEALAEIASRSTRDVTEKFTAFQKGAFKKMKSIIDAPDDVCVSILSKNGFKLNDAIERFYRGER